MAVVVNKFLSGAPNAAQVDSTDHYGVQQYLAPNGEVVAVPLYKLLGDSLAMPTLDTTSWTPALGTGGAQTTNTGQLVLSTGTTANNATSVTSVHIARFRGLAPNKARIPSQFPDGGTANNTRRLMVVSSDLQDGAFFELSGTTLKCVARKGGVDTPVSSGAFNGQFGRTYSPGTASHFLEMIWQPRQVIWLSDNTIIHTLAATNAPWSNTLHFGLRFENTNSGGLASNVDLNVRLATIASFGIPEVQGFGYFQQGLTAGVVLKIGPGNLNNLVLSGILNNAVVTLYDNTAASGRVLFTTGAMASNTMPFPVPMGKILFDIGLTLAITGAACNAQVDYD